MDLVIFTPTGSGVAGSTCQCMERLRLASPSMNLDYAWDFVIGDSLAPRFYSVIAYRFLKNYKAPYLLILDSDIVFQPRDVEKMLAALRSGKHVVGGLYPVADGSTFASYISDQYMVTGDLVEAVYLANGFKGISRAILQRLVKKLKLPLLQKGSWCECYPFFECRAANSLFVSEDWDFCDKVRAVGEKVYAHTGIQLGHVKSHIVWAQDVIKRKGIFKGGESAVTSG